MNLSFGYIETRGLIGAIEAADAMLKAARVRLLKTRRVGAALVTVVVEGELDACQAAVDAGRKAAARIGELISAHVIPHPYSDTEWLTRDIQSSQKSTDPQQYVKPVRKKQSPKKTKKQAPKTPAEQVMSLIKKRTREGILLSEIASSLGISDKEVRLIVKELMDKNKVERVQKKYYWIEDV